MNRPLLKSLFLSFVFVNSFSSIFAAPKLKSTVNLGLWRYGATWDLNRVPATSDTIVILANQTVIVDNPNTLGNVYVQVFGTLRFLHGKLTLGSGSVVVVYPSGKIEGESNSEKIRIGAIEVFNGADPDIIGPSIANITTGTGFSPFTLPVTFLDFYLTPASTTILLEWATTEEIQADRFEVEASPDGKEWSMLSSIKAKGSFSGITQYAYAAPRSLAPLTYFRIKQVDQNGRFMYSGVRIFKQPEGDLAGLFIGSSKGRVVLRFPKERSDRMLVRIFNLSGQAISHRYLNNAHGIITLDLRTDIKGAVVVSVETTTGRTSMQVVL